MPARKGSISRATAGWSSTSSCRGIRFGSNSASAASTALGRRRTVHAINLLADGTAERTVLASLLRRIDRIRISEIDIASCVINQTEAPPRAVPEESVAEVDRFSSGCARGSAPACTGAAFRRRAIEYPAGHGADHGREIGGILLRVVLSHPPGYRLRPAG